MQDAVIFDMDGTLCDVSQIRHLIADDSPNRNFHAFHVESTGCPPVSEVAGLWHSIRPGVAKIVVTARTMRYFQHSLWWLLLNGFEPDDMFMRQWHDSRPDYIVKGEILEVIRQRYNPVFAIDDNPAVIRLWQEQNIPHLIVPGFFS